MPLDAAAIDARLAEPSNDVLRAEASQFHHPLLPSIALEPQAGLTPDQAAIVAVMVNPALRAARDQHGSSQAALLQAGLLPNPQLSYNFDWVTGGNTLGAVNAYGWGLSYDITTLIAHDANVRAAQATAESVDLGIAWQEWQTAEAAKQSACDLISLQAQCELAEQVDRRLQQNLELLKRAASEGLRTIVDVSAAEAAADEAHATFLQAHRDLENQRLSLNRALGLPPTATLTLKPGVALPSYFELPSRADLLDRLDQRRLDLVALRRGYESQEQTLRAAVLNQFPKINLGFNRSSDDTGVHLAGLAVTIDLPLFDRNQGVIAQERATRQRLFDEYTSRVFDARADIALAVADLAAINAQITAARTALPNLAQLVEVYGNAVEHGNADVLSYYAASNDLAGRQLEILKLQQQLADNRIALELACGEYFPEAARSSEPSPATQPSTEAKRASGSFKSPMAIAERP